MFTQDSSQVLKSQRGLPGSYFQVKEVPRDLSLLASETETETEVLIFCTDRQWTMKMSKQ